MFLWGAVLYHVKVDTVPDSSVTRSLPQWEERHIYILWLQIVKYNFGIRIKSILQRYSLPPKSRSAAHYTPQAHVL